MTDFYSKLISGNTFTHVKEKGSVVQAAPPDHQNTSGLCERNWQTVSHMAQVWLSSNLLPPSFCWYAVKGAVKVSNYLPVKKGGEITTPHFLAY
eukprot:2115530-Ditylum_brightwellii.AAC.1